MSTLTSLGTIVGGGAIEIVTPEPLAGSARQALNDNFRAIYDGFQDVATNNAAVNYTSKAIGTIYQNTTGKPVFLSITVVHSNMWNTVILNIAAASASLPSSGGNATTVTSSSTLVTNQQQLLVAMVPPGWYYNLTTDGGTGWSIAYWIETAIG
jgi:hypothetical protein